MVRDTIKQKLITKFHLKTLQLTRNFRYAIIGIILISFIICYNIIVTDDHHFILNHTPIHRPLLSKIEPGFNSTDFHTLYNITYFKFTIQQPPCSDLNLKLDLLVLVHSSPYNEMKRKVIRRTWASQEQNAKFGNFRVLFLLGIVLDTQKQDEIAIENDEFKDIIQGSFIDHYHNLTYKHLMGFKWYKYFCEKTKVVLKVDDDVFVNTPFILQSFETNYWETVQDSNKDFIICPVAPAHRIKRNNDSKWFVSKEEWQGDYYPNYCKGYAIFYSGHTILKLYDEAPMVQYLFVDDALVTGFLRKRTGINLTNFKSLLINRQQLLINIKGHRNAIKNFFIGPYNIDYTTLEEFWNAFITLMNKSNVTV